MPEKQTYQEEELSFKGLVLSIKVYIRAILKAWKWIALFVLLGFGIFTLLGIKNHKWYEAEVSFMINDTQGGLGESPLFLANLADFWELLKNKLTSRKFWSFQRQCALPKASSLQKL
ncbi:MAG: hypothetical protein IPK61_00210 [Saprospiraceae bacterium]|nr:hypothetical protein [Saprospiraceae bacterium]